LAGERRIDFISPASVRDVQRAMAQSLEQAGFDIVGRDYEGFEAEVYFTGEDGSGLVMILQGCGDQDEGHNTLAAVRILQP
jgi:hypothetical protein